MKRSVYIIVIEAICTIVFFYKFGIFFISEIHDLNRKPGGRGGKGNERLNIQFEFYALFIN